MTHISKAVVYIGNTDDIYCGFTVGKVYKVLNYNTEDNYIGVYDDDGGYGYIKNGAFHKFGMHKDDQDFVTDSEFAVMTPSDDKNHI